MRKKFANSRICNVFEIPQLVRNIMVTDYFFFYSYFFQFKEKKEKNFWDMEIIGNRRKNYFPSKIVGEDE